MTFLICLFPLVLPPQLHFKWEAGMNMSPVSRLKKTWAKVKTAKFDVLEVCEADASLLTLYTQEVGFCRVSLPLDQGVLQRRKPIYPSRRREWKGVRTGGGENKPGCRPALS